ncbi:oxygenase MpaB family protein [Sphingomonas sp. H160509]|uniref:oxygenase MpaB family protein n=1 Tax=Sphingomonas sp. H160509 TaxID=2955313 RepID=UPI00406BEF64
MSTTDPPLLNTGSGVRDGMNDSLLSIRDQTKTGIVRQVRTLFNDQARGEEPVKRSDTALFPPDSMIWRVHGDVVSMMVGGVSALLLQMLHPAVLAGVWDHSNFRTDMLGRLRRTARFIAATTYGERAEAEAAIARVRAVHSHIGGVLPNGTPYRADDPSLLAWVHVSEAWSFLAAWQHYGDRRLTLAQEDLYYAEFASIGSALGADAPPAEPCGHKSGASQYAAGVDRRRSHARGRAVGTQSDAEQPTGNTASTNHRPGGSRPSPELGTSDAWPACVAGLDETGRSVRYATDGENVALGLRRQLKREAQIWRSSLLPIDGMVRE